MRIQSRNRAMLIAIVGGYLIYLAYELLQNLLNGDTGMSKAVFILFITFFTIAGIGLLFYAWKVYQRGKKEDAENKETCDSDDSIKN